MKVQKYTEQSAKVLEQVARWGFSPAIQQRIGAFAVVWGLFESNLEPAIWELQGNEVHGVRPWTDKSPISEWLKALLNDWPQLSTEALDVIKEASNAATDLMEYRHTIMHGWMLPSTDMPSFIRNPRWHGEERKRLSHDAYVDENLLNMAIDSAWVLCQVVLILKTACTNPYEMGDLVALKPEVHRVRGQTSELRHLTELMNHEKN